jgi:hypothetical protein
MDFVKYHKRVTRNYFEKLQHILESDKQTVLMGINSNYRVTLNYIRLNRSCTLANIWWSLQIMPAEIVPDDVRQF